MICVVCPATSLSRLVEVMLLKQGRIISVRQGVARHVSTIVPRPVGRNSRKSNTVSEAGKDAESRSAASLGAVELPHGVLWWHNKQHSVYQHNVYHGGDFILQRQRSGGPGLILSHQLSSVQIVDKHERARAQLATYKTALDDTGALLVVSDLFTFDVTDYELVEESVGNAVGDDADPPQYLPTACTGIVLRDQAAGSKQQVGTFFVIPSGNMASRLIFFGCDFSLDTSWHLQADDQIFTSHARRTKAVRVFLNGQKSPVFTKV